VIPLSTIQDLCWQAGIDPCRVMSVEVSALTCRFTVTSLDAFGNRYVRGDEVATHFIEVPVGWRS
jgi:hypothetical protein